MGHLFRAVVTIVITILLGLNTKSSSVRHQFRAFLQHILKNSLFSAYQNATHLDSGQKTVCLLQFRDSRQPKAVGEHPKFRTENLL